MPTRGELVALGLSASCAEVLGHLWDYLDDEIDGAGAARMRAHIGGCAECRAYAGAERCFLQGLAALKRELQAPRLLRERVARRLQREGCGCWERARRKDAG